MSRVRYILGEKVRKDLCHVPALLNQGRADSAARLVDKHRDPRSPMILGFDIAVAETRGERTRARKLYRGRDTVLRHAARRGPDEVVWFFTYLFAFHVRHGNLTKARAVFRAGRSYGLGQSDYGMLWARYCDAAGLIAEGRATVKRILGDRKFSAAERKFLVEHYPGLDEAGAFGRARR